MATFLVNNASDRGIGSLRQAIADANELPGLDTIEFANNLNGQTITLTSGELQISDDLTINGLGADLLTISGNNNSRVFLVDDEDNLNLVDVVIDGLTITESNNGGISNLENLTVLNSDISKNIGFGISSGSIDNNSGNNLTIINSNISDNAGTGISHSFDGNLTVANSNILNNRYGIFGQWGVQLDVTSSNISGNRDGGIGIFLGAELILTDSTISNNTGSGISSNRSNFEINNSTISGNVTTGSGGGINADHFSGSIENSTITNNIADRNGDGSGNGGGISFSDYSMGTFSNTIIAGNFDNSPADSEHHPDISGLSYTFNSSGFNLTLFCQTPKNFEIFNLCNPYIESDCQVIY